MNYNVKESGKRIRALRLQNKLTQEELAKQLSIDRSLLSHVEAGKRGCSVDLLVRFSSFFSVSLDYLVMGTVHSGLFEQSHKQITEDVDALIDHLKIFRAALQVKSD